MHPELEEILSLCRKADMHVQLTTNGTLLKKAEPLLLRYPPRQINISVHSFSQQPAQMQERYMADVLHCGKTLSAQGTYVSSLVQTRRQTGRKGASADGTDLFVF